MISFASFNKSSRLIVVLFEINHYPPVALKQKAAGVAELVDALDLKSNSGLSLSAGSSPAAGTLQKA